MGLVLAIFRNFYLESKLLSKEDLFSKISASLSAGKGVGFSFLNPYSYSIVCSNEQVIEGIDGWFVDGASLCYILRFFAGKKVTRASFDFSSIAGDIFDFCSKNGYSIGLVGGLEQEVFRTSQYLKKEYPKLDISYIHHGYFDVGLSQEMGREISLSGTDFLICGLGTPRQEEFVIEARKAAPKTVFFTCGGFISQTAMKGDYYHPLVKLFGVRWLQRAIFEKHVRSRLLIEYPKFLFFYLLSFKKK